MKKSNMDKPMCNYTWAFLSKNDVQFFPSVFSPFWRENFFMGPGRKHLDPTIYFLPPHPTKHTSKSFPSHFFSKVFQPPYFTSKQTHLKRYRLVTALCKILHVIRQQEGLPYTIRDSTTLPTSLVPNTRGHWKGLVTQHKGLLKKKLCWSQPS